MAKTKEQEQLDVAKALAPYMERIAASYEKISEASGAQIEAMKQLNDAINSIRTQGVVEQFEQVSQSAQEVAKDVEKSSVSSQKSISDLTKEATKSGNFFKRNFPAAVGFTVGAFSGFRQTLKNVFALLRSGFGLFKGFVGSIYNVGKAIFSIPFKMLGGLADIVNNAGGSNELFVAIENIRKEFGALTQTGPSTIFSMAKNLEGFSATGLSSYRIFGNMAQRLEAFLKLAQAMGPTFENFSDEFKKNGGAILAWQKGLGMSDEDMRTLGERAKTMGIDMTSQFLEIQKQTDALGEQFGISTKLIGRDMAKALKDVKHFGGATIKEIATASVYARKLGVELDKITGVLDAFETFEGAAENAAKLSQSFGVQVDAFKMMEAQDPASQIEMLRKQFAAAGQDVSKFNRQQLKLLSTTTGLDEATAKQVFSLKNQGMSLEQIKKQSEKAEKKQLSQAEAMDKLANAIERMAQSGGGTGGGFFDKFLHGIFGGIQASKEFREIIMNIRMAFRTLITEGVRLGKAIAANPYVKDFLGGIASFFNPGKFRPLIRGVTDELIKLVKGQSSFPEVIKNIKEKFFDYFDSNSAAGKKILNAVKGIFKGIVVIAAEAIKMAASTLKDGIVYITDLLTGKKKIASIGEDMGMFGEILSPLYDALAEAYDILAPALSKLFDVLIAKLETFFKQDLLPLLKEYAPEIALALFGPAFLKGVVGAFAGGMGSKVKDVITGFFSKSVAPEVADAASSVAKKGGMAGGISETMAKRHTETIDSVKGLHGKIDDLMKAQQGDKWGARDAAKLGLKLLAIAAALAVGGVILAGAVVLISHILGEANQEQLTNTLILLGGLVLASVPLMFAIKLASDIPLGTVAKGAAALGMALLAVGATAGIINWLFEDNDTSKMPAIADFMLQMSLVFVAMVPLLVGAAAIGALVVGSLGLGLLAIGAGIGVITGAVVSVATVAKDIMQELDKMTISKDFQPKVDAFLGIMESIQKFADTLVSLFEIMEPSLIDLLQRTSFVDKVNSAIDLLKQFVGEKGSGKGIIGVVELVMEQLKTLKATPDMQRSAEIMSNLLTGVAELMKASVPPESWFTEMGSIWNSAASKIEITTRLKTYLDDQKERMSGLVEVLVKQVKVFENAKLPDEASAKSISAIINSIANVAKNVLPDSKFIDTFAEVEKNGEESERTLDIEKVTTFMTSYLGALKPLLTELTSGVVTSIISQLSTLDVNKLEKLSSIATIMTVVIDLMKVINDMSKNQNVNVSNVQMGAVVNITTQIPSITKILNELGTSMGPLMSSISTAVQALPAGSDFNKKIETAKSLFAILAQIPQLVKEASGGELGPKYRVIMKGGYLAGLEIYEPLIDSIKVINETLDKLVNSNELQNFFGYLKTLNYELSSDKGKITNAIKGAETFFGQVEKIVNTFKGLSGLNAGDINIDNIMNNLYKVSQVIESLVTGRGQFDIKSSSFGSKISPIERLKDSLTDKVIKDVESASTRVGKYATWMGKISTAINDGGLKAGMMAITEMVTKAQAMNDALTNLPDLKLDAKLQPLAKGLGLGGKFNYTIASKDVVLKICLNVEMNAKDMEEALIMRKDSIIRDRLNFCTETPVSTGNNKIPQTRGPLTPITSKTGPS